MTRESLRLMKMRNYGRILLIASIAGKEVSQRERERERVERPSLILTVRDGLTITCPFSLLSPDREMLVWLHTVAVKRQSLV